MTVTTQAAAMDIVRRTLDESGYQLTYPERFWDDIDRPIAYGEQFRATGPRSGELNGTRNRLQVIIERFGFDEGARAGRYEVIAYVG